MNMKSLIISAAIAVPFCCNASNEGGELRQVPNVYMTTDISPDGLVRVYEALGVKASGRVAVKISTGEPGGHNYLKPTLIKNLVQQVGGTIVECNTAYEGRRNTTEAHLEAAREHGFFDIANVDIMDAEGDMKLAVKDTSHIKYNLVGGHLANYDFMINLAHFKGHAMGGFGGVLKNQSIGVASSRGKAYIHSAGVTDDVVEMWQHIDNQDGFLESMAAAAQSVHDYFGNGDRIIYINVMNNMSIDCDCDAHPAEPLLKDVGILASTDPVALDQACLELVFAIKPEEGNDNRPLIERINSLHGTHIVDYAEKIGLGSKKYNLIDIDSIAIAEAVETLVERYPQATLQDVYKSFFQDYFGPAHIMSSREAVKTYIESELSMVDGGDADYYEPCGWRGNYVRVNLSIIADSVITVDELVDAFVASAAEVSPELIDDWTRQWAHVQSVVASVAPEMAGFESDAARIAELLGDGKYVVHHSQKYNESYQPHYRIIRRDLFDRLILPKIKR